MINGAMKKRIFNAMLRTWDAIGADTLTMLEEAGEPAVLPKDEVIELVIDADRLREFGGDKEAIDTLYNLPSYEQKVEVGREAFTFDRYSW
jgi:formate-dependent phosphoribosylglycinamide formyltransferase (GAR transformylase)